VGITPGEAFDTLYALAAPALVHQTYLLTGRSRLAQESVERAFQLAWGRWPEVASDPDPAGWVRAAAYEHAMSPWHRLRRSHKHPDNPADAVSMAPDTAEAAPLRAALLALPPVYRRALLLYDGLGVGLPETAAETEASTSATAARLVHARAAGAARLPGLRTPAVHREYLGMLTLTGPEPQLPTARDVRTGCELRARFWT
jgi:DNA-directed RNA polymerase specialized sigma24 family protein